MQRKWLYFLICLLVVAFGVMFDQLSSRAGYIIQEIRTLDPNGSIGTKSLIALPPLAKLFQSISIFLYTLSISAFISIFIIDKLETERKKQHLIELDQLHNSINKDVFDSLFKILIPKEIFNAIKKDIIGNKIIRKDADWMYDFKVIEDNKIEMIQTVKYELHNVSHEPVEDAVSAIFDGHPSKCGLRKAVCTLNGLKIAYYERSDEDEVTLQKSKCISSNDGNVRICREENGNTRILINLIIPPGQLIDVTFVYINHYDNNYVNDGYFTKYPMINAKLTATYPSGYEFTIFQALSTDLKCTLDDTGRKIYEAKGGILPHQGLIYTLKKLDKVEDEAISNNGVDSDTANPAA